MTLDQLISAVERAVPEIRSSGPCHTSDIYTGRCLRWLAARRYTVTVSVTDGVYGVDVDDDGTWSGLLAQSDDASLAVALLRCVLKVADPKLPGVGE